MAGTKLTNAMLVLAAHAPTARAFWGQWGGYGEPSGVMDVPANSPLWDQAIALSNASSEITFTGRDVSKPWPGEPMEGWKVNMTIVDMSGGPWVNWEDDTVTYSGFLVGDDLRVKAPKSLLNPSKNASDHGMPVVDTHDDWVFCAWRWYNPGYSNVSIYRNPDNLDAAEDGSCEKFVSKECIEAVEKAARTSYSMNYEPKGIYGSRHTCERFDIPEECGPGSSKGTSLSEHRETIPNWGVPIRYLNGSTTWQGGYDVDRDNYNETHLMWRALTQDIQPVLTLFGKYHNDSDTYEVEPGFTKLLCLRSPESGLRAGSDKEESGSGGGGGGNGGAENDEDDNGGEGAAVALSGRQSAFFACAVALLAWVL